MQRHVRGAGGSAQGCPLVRNPARQGRRQGRSAGGDSAWTGNGPLLRCSSSSTAAPTRYPSSTLHPTTLRRDPTTLPSTKDTKLRMFIDSASPTEWEQWLSTNLFYGVTTNPVILEKDGQRCTLANLSRLCRLGEDLGAQELQFQAWGDCAQKLVSVALDIFGMNPALVVVKLPCTVEGLKAAALLHGSSVRVTMTGLYTSSQVLLATNIGAEYAAPYLGRMSDAYGTERGYREVVDMQRILTAQQSPTRLLVASVRDTASMASLAAEGCDTFTISPATASKLFVVSHTVDAAEAFEGAARRMGAYEAE